jgi:hypothetical protein
MPEKDSSPQWSAEEWCEAYSEMVRKVTGYLGFNTKSTTFSIFQSLALKYPLVNPFLFMTANSPQYRDWSWFKNKYPYPSMLSGDTAVDYYNKFIKQGITTAIPRKEAIIKAVESSCMILKRCKISAEDYEGIWDMYILGQISPFYIACNREMNKWISSRLRKQEISMEEKKILDKATKVIYTYHMLNVEIHKIMKGN